MKNGLVFLSANALVMGSNYLFHFLSGRALSPVSYGVLSSLLAFFGIIAFATVGLQTRVAEEACRQEAQGQFSDALRTAWLKKGLLWGVGLYLGCLILSPIGVWFFHTDQVILQSFLPIVLLIMLLSIVRGFLQGLQYFGVLSGGLLLESLIKTALAFFFYSKGWSLLPFIMAITISPIIPLLWGEKKLQTHQISKSSQSTPSYSSFGGMLLFFILFALWFNLDMILIQHWHPEQAGSYSVAAKFGQVFLFAIMTISQFCFPLWITALEHKKSTAILHLWSLLLILGGAIIGLTILFFWGSFLIPFLFGVQYPEAASYLLRFGWLGGQWGLLHYIAHWHMAKKRTAFLLPLFILTIGMFVHLCWHLASNVVSPETLSLLISWSAVMILCSAFAHTFVRQRQQ